MDNTGGWVIDNSFAGRNCPNTPIEVFREWDPLERILLPSIAPQVRTYIVEGSQSQPPVKTKACEMLPTLQFLDAHLFAQKSPAVFHLPSAHRIAVRPRNLRPGYSDHACIGERREHLLQPGLSHRNGVLDQHDAESAGRVPNAEIASLAVIEGFRRNRDCLRSKLTGQV